jgi:hypothetical protein
MVSQQIRHAGDRFVWNESGRTQYALRVQTMDGLQPNQHPVPSVLPARHPGENRDDAPEWRYLKCHELFCNSLILRQVPVILIY